MMLVDPASSACSAQAPEDGFLRHALESSTSEELDRAFVIRAGNILQTLFGLSQLIRENVDDAGKVRTYANRAEEKLQALGELMRPMLWSSELEKSTSPEREASV